MTTYRIRAVDGSNPDKSEVINDLHQSIFGGKAPPVDTRQGYWWIVTDWTDKPVAFAGLHLLVDPLRGYLYRVGVSPDHRGHGLQRKLIAVRVAKARSVGCVSVVSDTVNWNVHSSNNLIASGFRLFKPKKKWAFKDGLYWQRTLKED